MNKTKNWCLLALTFVVFAACSQRQKYVTSEFIEIEYWGKIQENQWIEVDGLRLYHVANDTTGGCDPNYEHNYLSLNKDPEAEKYFIPATTYLSCLTQGKWAERDLTNGDMAFNLLSALNEFALQDEISLQLPYKNNSSVYFTTMGKLQLQRTDGKPMKVTTSENYKGAVRAIAPPQSDE